MPPNVVIDPDLCEEHTKQLMEFKVGLEGVKQEISELKVKVDEVGDDVRTTNSVMLRAVEAFEGRTKVRTALFQGVVDIGKTLAGRFEYKTLLALGFVILTVGALIGTVSVADIRMPWEGADDGSSDVDEIETDLPIVGP